jgi:hypothetical protein
VEEEIREGFYKDKYGCWQEDRRQSGDRRGHPPESFEHEHRRRRVARRRADRERQDFDHRLMIDEALDEFAGEHGGHL